MFLTDKGYDLGARDKEVFEQLKDKPVCSKAYPNLYRWQDYMKNKNQRSVNRKKVKLKRECGKRAEWRDGWNNQAEENIAPLEKTQIL